MDKLDEIFEMQHRLQMEFEGRTGIAFAPLREELIPDSPVRRPVKENVLAAIVELTEILGETNWKEWRGPKEGLPNWDRYCTEVADLFKFATNLAIIGGMDGAELLRRLRAKDQVNVERMRNEFTG